MKKTLIFALGVLLLASLSLGVAFAQPGNVSVQEEEVDFIFVQGTADLIWKGVASLTDWGNGSVSIWGMTQTYSTVEYVSGRVYLQRWDGSRWVNIDSRLFYRFNHSYASGGKSTQVTPGWYRAHGIHYAEHQGVSDTQYVTTSPIYVN